MAAVQHPMQSKGVREEPNFSHMGRSEGCEFEDKALASACWRGQVDPAG